MPVARRELIGNRLALAGAVLYFLEWVAIAFLPSVPTDKLGRDPVAIVDVYRGHAGVIAFAAGWFSVVLLGRVLYVAGVRRALAASGCESALADVALVAMGVSVALEVASFGLVATAGWLTDAGASASAVVSFDTGGSIVYLMAFGPLGVSVVTSSLAMLRSRAFPPWLGWLGVVVGAFAVLGGILEAAATGKTGTFHDLGTIPLNIGVAGFWIWIVVTGAILWRHTPRTSRS
jgi:hypothetical protein